MCIHKQFLESKNIELLGYEADSLAGCTVKIKAEGFIRITKNGSGCITYKLTEGNPSSAGVTINV